MKHLNIKIFQAVLTGYTGRKADKMETIRIYNDHTGEVLEKTFADPIDADNYEFILDFLEARYERFHNGKKLY